MDQKSISRIALYAILAFLLFFHPSTASSLPDLSNLDINGNDIVDQLLHLATFTDDPNPAVTRILFTENDVKGRTYIKSLMQDAGLVVSEDSMGSIFGTWSPSSIHQQPAIATGSHCDAIPLAGAYDGTLGVLGGIAALRSLQRAGFRPSSPLQVIMFTSEEPTRFGLSCIGSRAMAGVLFPPALAHLKDANGTSFLNAAHAAGSSAQHTTEKTALQAARLTRDAVTAFVELHIEQGPELEQESLDIGIVTAIAAPATLRLEFRGTGGHAGALLMPRRNDAFLAAAELALQVEHAALSTGSEDTVATTGSVRVAPNAVNSVPRVAVLEIDIRDTDAARRDLVLERIQRAATEIAKKRKVKLVAEVLNSDPPATSDAAVIGAISGAIEELKLSSKKMVSRAYHDALFMAQVAPMGMIFVPCEGGKSHRPDEFVSPRDVENGVRVLAGTLARLAGSSPVLGAGRDGEL